MLPLPCSCLFCKTNGTTGEVATTSMAQPSTCMLLEVYIYSSPHLLQSLALLQPEAPICACVLCLLLDRKWFLTDRRQFRKTFKNNYGFKVNWFSEEQLRVSICRLSKRQKAGTWQWSTDIWRMLAAKVKIITWMQKLCIWMWNKNVELRAWKIPIRMEQTPKGKW